MKCKWCILGVLVILLFACKDDNKGGRGGNTASDNTYVNKWIMKEMKTYYLWNEQLPSPSQERYEANPSDFFKSILYKYEQAGGDRFSWIQEDYVELLNSLSGVTSYDIGFEYILYSEGEKSDNITGQVAYIKPGTHAEKLGIKRGDAFTHVDGTRLTKSNYKGIFKAATAKVGFISRDEKITEKNITLSHNYAQNPVYLDTIYTEGTTKVGYLVYNFFASDNGDKSYKYDLQLNEAFGRFKAANITHMVVDFRYNSGGSMNSATLLGSMLVPNLNTNNVFTKLQYNKLVEAALVKENGQGVLVDKFRDMIDKTRINNIGNNLQGLYFLTSSSTASASELIINNLKPYMGNTITLIGNTTAGKNVGSITLYKERDTKNKWGMQPIVLKYTNKEDFSDFESGFEPQIKELDNYLFGKLPLGDKEEVMLNIALSKINGTYAPKKSSALGLDIVSSSVESKAWANHVIVNFDNLKVNE